MTQLNEGQRIYRVTDDGTLYRCIVHRTVEPNKVLVVVSYDVTGWCSVEIDERVVYQGTRHSPDNALGLADIHYYFTDEDVANDVSKSRRQTYGNLGYIKPMD